MRRRLSLAVAAALVAAGVLACGCKKKAPASKGPPRVVFVGVWGSVDERGHFKKGGFSVGKQQIDGTDPDALAGALRAARATAAKAGRDIHVRIAVPEATPYGAVRRILAASASVGVREMSLACFGPAAGGQITADSLKGIGFCLPEAPRDATTAARAPRAPKLHIRPSADGKQATYELPGAPGVLGDPAALCAALTKCREAMGAKVPLVIWSTDDVQAQFVATGMGEARRAGFKSVQFAAYAGAWSPPVSAAQSAAGSGGDDANQPIPTGPRPASDFSGASGLAYNVVYLIDRSGSMAATFDVVRRELIESINSLDAAQEFHVILFGGRSPIESPTRKLIAANAANKLATAKFLDTIPASGMTNPIAAIDRAFDVLDKARRHKPGKLVYLLTDGDFSEGWFNIDNEKVLAAVRDRNGKKDVIVHTLLFGAHTPAGEKVLEQIAEENGGKYRFVKAEQ